MPGEFQSTERFVVGRRAKCCRGPSRDGALGVIGVCDMAGLTDKDLNSLKITKKEFITGFPEISKQNRRYNGIYEKKSNLGTTNLPYCNITSPGILRQINDDIYPDLVCDIYRGHI